MTEDGRRDADGAVRRTMTEQRSGKRALLFCRPSSVLCRPSAGCKQPYLLLALPSLFFAGNVVIARSVAGHVPPVALSLYRWGIAFLLVLPFTLGYVRRDWPEIRRHMPILTILALTGYAGYNTMAYYGLQYTEAINALLIQSMGPLFVAAVDADAVRRTAHPDAGRRHHGLVHRGHRDHLSRRPQPAAERQREPRRHLVPRRDCSSMRSIPRCCACARRSIRSRS